MSDYTREDAKRVYDHHMISEILEQPKIIADNLSQHINSQKQVVFDELKLASKTLENFNRILILACGTAHHAGVYGRYLLEKLTRLPVEVAIASEYPYQSQLVDNRTLCIAISQSGETTDTLAALKLAREYGAYTIGIINVKGSTMERMVDDVIYTEAGTELAIPSTKAYTNQLLIMSLLAMYLGANLNNLLFNKISSLVDDLEEIPYLMERIIANRDLLVDLGDILADQTSIFYLGHGLDYAVALEGALKFKESTYIHATAYQAGEFRHGSAALLEDNTPVVHLITQNLSQDKVLAILKDNYSRQANNIIISTHTSVSGQDLEDFGRLIRIPETDELFMPFLSVIPLQLMSYYTAVARGINVDEPRNLTKAVI